MPLGDNPFGGGGGAPAAPAATPTPAPMGGDISPAPASTSGGGLGANPFGAGGAPSGGGGGGLLSTAANLGGAGLSFLGKTLNAGEQVLFHGAGAVGSVARGDYGVAARKLEDIPGAVAGDPAKTVTFLGAAGQEGAKLPWGLHNTINAAGGVAGDPLNFVTLGFGPEARAAAQTLKEAEAGGLLATGTADAIRSGGMKSIDPATQAAIRNTLLAKAGDVGAEHAAKIADTGMSALGARGMGGLGFHVPGTDIGAHIAGSFDRPEMMAALGDRFPKLAGVFSPARDEANIAAAQAAKENATGEAARVMVNAKLMGMTEAERASALAGEQVGRMGARLTPEEISSATSRFKDLGQAAGKAPAAEGSLAAVKGNFDKVQGVIRSQLLAFPGTVVNRARRISEVLGLDGLMPWKQPAAFKDAIDLTKSGAAVEAKLGLNSGSIDKGIEKIISQGEKDHAAWQAARDAGFPAGPVAEPKLHDYQSGMDEYLKQQGLRGTSVLKSALDKAGVDSQRFLAARQIVHDGPGGGMYRGTDFMRPRLIPKGEGKASKLYEAATRPLRTGATKVREAGSYVENLGKTVGALHNLDRYGNIEQATEHLANTMGDPWKLTRTEKFISPVSPFWGAIRNHMESVARMGFDNPARVSIANHLLGSASNPFGQGSGNPIGSTGKVLEAPLQTGLGLAGGVSSLVGGPKFGQGALVKGLEGGAGLTAGAIPAAGRALYGAKMMGAEPKKALVNVAKTFAPSVQRLPIPGKKADLKSQIEKFITGMTAGAPTGG